jgi:hypothetical protein
VEKVERGAEKARQRAQRDSDQAWQKAQRDAEHERQKAQRAAEQSRAEFDKSPRGQARAAKLAGDRYFQFELVLEQNARLWGMTGSIGTTQKRHGGFGALLTEIEAEGWALVQAGWLFRQTGAISRDKLLSSGQQVATEGKTVGVYLFTVTDTPALTDQPWLDASDDGVARSAFGPPHPSIGLPDPAFEPPPPSM